VANDPIEAGQPLHRRNAAGPPVSAAIRAALDACASECRAWPEQQEGPYYRLEAPVRRDVVEDAPGFELMLGLRLFDGRRAPLTDTTVEIWQCDALGRYSGFPPPEPATEYVADRMFLRGVQAADDGGAVEFRTVYPGWYPGRTLHIHLRAHVGRHAFTSQLYFPEPINEQVLLRPPYSTRPGRDTMNDTDSIAATGGGPAVLDVTSGVDAYLATTCLLVPTDGLSP
jgi:protocatechuate 3,4-dioxygenase beta subunit